METIIVDLGKNSYPIYVTSNGWDDLSKSLQCHHFFRTILIVADENVHPIFHESLSSIFKTFGIKVLSEIIPSGEKTKSLNMYNSLVTSALNKGLDRKSTLVALGGGVTGDLTGFVAATYMRGIDFIQIPTTLLAQVDSSVGGKVAINHELAKNIIGSYHQPKFVYINIKSLATLPKREFSSGMAELIKHGLIHDHIFLNDLNNKMGKLMSMDYDALEEAVSISCRIKAQIVEQDEKEEGIRAILNFGHTIGHAIEAIAGYDNIKHGEAISMGMVYESKIAREIGLVNDDYIDSLINILEKAGLPTRISGLDPELLITKMYMDKKNLENKLTFILPTDYGKVAIFRDIASPIVRSVLK